MYDEQELDEESEPEIPIYNRAELIEQYNVSLSQILVLSSCVALELSASQHVDKLLSKTSHYKQ